MMERMWIRDPSYPVSGNVNWCYLLWRTEWRFHKKKLKIELPYNPAISLLGIYLKKIII